MLRKGFWQHLFDTQVISSSSVGLAPANSFTDSVFVLSLSGRFFSRSPRTNVILQQTRGYTFFLSFFFLYFFFYHFQFWSLLELDQSRKHWGKTKRFAESALASVQQRVPCEFPRNECGNCKLLTRRPSERTVLRQLSTRWREGTCGSCDTTSTYPENCFLIKH